MSQSGTIRICRRQCALMSTTSEALGTAAIG